MSDLPTVRQRPKTVDGMGERVLRRRWCDLTAVIALLTAPNAWAEGLSGTYVGKSANGTALLQIVETSDGHLLGRYEEVTLQVSGKIDHLNAVLTGAADGSTIVLTIKPTELLSGTFAASGTVEGRLLHLSGGGYGASFNVTLLRSDEAAFRADVASLTDLGNQITDARMRQEAAQQQAKIEADRLAQLQHVTQQMLASTARMAKVLPNFTALEQRYHEITERMGRALARERSIYGEGQASVVRGQIGVAINQLAIQANQLHLDVDSSSQTFDFKTSQLRHESADALRSCQDAHIATAAAPVSAGYEGRNAACLRLFGVAQDYEKDESDIRAAFATAERVWEAERLEQNQIVKASRFAAQ